MAIATLCPGCQSLFRLPDTLAGTQVRCQKCGRLLMVPGVLAAPAKAAPPPKPVPRAESVPAAPRIAAPRIAAPPPVRPPSSDDTAPLDGLPAVVLVEVPVKPTPPPMPEEGQPAAPPAQAAAKRPIPPITLQQGRDRGRRPSNRPRRPTSVLAGLALAVMGVLFVALFGVSAITWLVTTVTAHPQPQRPVFVQQQPQPQPPMGGGPNVPPRPPFNDKLAKKIVLKDGAAFTPFQMNNNDLRDPVKQLPCTVFLVELEAGHKYLFDYKRAQPVFNQFDQQQPDPYLRIEDQQGKQLDFNDDILQGQNLDSQLEFIPNQKGTYRIFCTLFQFQLRGQTPFTLNIREQLPPPPPKVAPPQSFAADRALAAPRRTEGDVTYQTLTNLPGGGPRADVCWSADGKAFFVLGGDGTLLRIALDGFVEQRRLQTPRPIPGSSSMALSGQGLVLSVPVQNEVWLIDPDDLKVKDQFSVTGAARVASAAGLDRAVVASLSRPPAPQFGFQQNFAMRTDLSRKGITLLDLAKKGAASRFYAVPNGAPAVVAAPDGGLDLFTLDDEVLTRFRVQANGDLTQEQTSFRLGIPPNVVRRIDVSPDGKYVCAAGSNAQALFFQDHPKVGPCPVYVYPVDNLRKPALGLSTGVPQHAIGFDPKADRVFAQAFRKPLVVFNFDGQRKAEYVLPGGLAQDPLQFLTHPDGNQLLVRFANRLCVVSFKPADPAAVAKADPAFPPPVAVADAEPVATAGVKHGDVVYRELKLPAPADDDLIGPCWDAEGEALFHLERDGTLTRLAGRDFTPDRRLPLGRPAVALARSSQGLLVALRDQPEVLVVSPQSLQVVRKIVCPGPVKYLAGHPKLALAVAVGTEVALLDTASGKVAARGLQGPDAGLAFQNPMLTPDGKYLLLAHAGAGTSKVLRVRIEPARLVVEDSRPTEVKGLHAFCVTADGKHVAWYAPNLKSKKQETAFYPMADWQAVAFTLPVRARALAAVDGGGLYVQTQEGATSLYPQPANQDTAAVPLHWREGRILGFAPRPQHAGAFVANTGLRVFYGER